MLRPIKSRWRYFRNICRFLNTPLSVVESRMGIFVLLTFIFHIAETSRFFHSTINIIDLLLLITLFVVMAINQSYNFVVHILPSADVSQCQHKQTKYCMQHKRHCVKQETLKNKLF